MSNRNEILTAAARNAADWLTNNQCLYPDLPYLSCYNANDANHGCFMNMHHRFATQWVNAFSSMACMGAYAAFDDAKYRNAAYKATQYNASLQIFSPFNKKHYGAIREMTPTLSWCYVRDSVSAAWAFIAAWRLFGDDEFLQRAVLFEDWLQREGTDDTGYPYWGVVVDPKGHGFDQPDMNHHLQGTFHGGTLNLFYQLYKATGDEKYIDERYTRLADLVIERIQQPNGMFLTFDRHADAPVKSDPQHDLHRANDDFNTIGLLGAYQITGEKKYLHAVDRFVAFLRKSFDPETGLGPQRSAVPVAINLLAEYQHMLGEPGKFADLLDPLCDLLVTFQDVSDDPLTHGGIVEDPNHPDQVGNRATQYAVTALLKYLDLDHQYIGLADMSPSLTLTNQT